jgi:hypothetical protein
VPGRQLRLRDDDGEWTEAGETIMFSYGIPPVMVTAEVVERNGRLIALCPGHSPESCNLRALRRYVGEWHKVATVTDQDRAELCDALTAIARDMRRAANRMHCMGGLYREHGRELAGAAMLAATLVEEIAAQARGAGE